MKFLGIDLGWRSQPSGLCCLAWKDHQLHLLDLDRKEAIEDVIAWVDHWAPPLTPKVSEPAIIAVDAPTLIPNATGMRLPDKLTHKYFGRYHAGCYPANLSLAFAQRTVSFGLQLEARGFAHAPVIEPQHLGRFQIEVYPHPAIVRLFGLERILKYKKGRLSERRSELIKLYQYIVDILPTLVPNLNPSALSSSQGFCLYCSSSILSEFPKTGAALKALEDKLDALICAYVAAHWWYWGLERNLVLGDTTTGYIIVPTLDA